MDFLMILQFLSLIITGLGFLYLLLGTDFLPNIVFGSIAITDRLFVTIMITLFWTVVLCLKSFEQASIGEIPYYLLPFLLFMVLLIFELVLCITPRKIGDD